VKRYVPKRDKFLQYCLDYLKQYELQWNDVFRARPLNLSAKVYTKDRKKRNVPIKTWDSLSSNYSHGAALAES